MSVVCAAPYSIDVLCRPEVLIVYTVDRARNAAGIKPITTQIQRRRSILIAYMTSIPAALRGSWVFERPPVAARSRTYDH